MERSGQDQGDRALSAVTGAVAALGSLLSGWLMEHVEWNSVFLVTLPLAVLALIFAVVPVPGNVNEATDPVDNGGILSVVLVAALVLAINFAAVPGTAAWLPASACWR